MLFNSARFLLFFPLVVCVYFAVPRRFQWALLLAASYFFYASARPVYVLLLFVSTLVCYLAGLALASRDAKKRRVHVAIAAVSVLLGLLFVFKYYNFFGRSLHAFTAALSVDVSLPASHFVLPLGISFYTFRCLSYVFEVYRGTLAPERHLGRFALYVSFFPQLLAGPIERPGNLLPQFIEEHAFDYRRVTDGLKLMVWGLFQKMVIADRLAQLVDTVYADPSRFPGPALTFAAVAYSIQIFCDFAGYSDIAIGASEVLGFRVMDNFRRPYFATSMADFWHRWHISLSTWFRDYLYIPLGGGRVVPARWYLNILIVFLLSGLWHGANWTFVVWGGLHGVYLMLGRALRPFRERLIITLGLSRAPWLLRILQTATTFALVTVAWVFFRATNLTQAITILKGCCGGWAVAADSGQLSALIQSLGFSKDELVAVSAMVLVMLAVHVAQSRGSVRGWVARQPLPVRWALYSAVMWCIVAFGVFTHKDFIYFTF